MRPSASCLSLPPCSAGISLACKRWSTLFFSTPALWREVAVVAPAGLDPYRDPGGKSATWAAGQAALLRRVAPLVESVTIGRPQDVMPADDNTHSVLYDSGGPAALLAQPGLQPLELALWQEPPRAQGGTARAVSSLTSLRSLLVHEGYDLEQPTTAAIASLAPRLRSLELHSCFIRAEQVRAALACAGLTRLALRPCVILGADGSWEDEPEESDQPPLMCLTRLSQLQELSIDHRPVWSARPPLAPPALPQHPNLLRH